MPVYEVGQDGDVRFYAMQLISGQGLDAVILELRRLRERAGSEPKVTAAARGQSLRPGGSHNGQGKDGPMIGEGVEASAVLQSILTGRFDPGEERPELAEDAQSMLARAAGRRAFDTGRGRDGNCMLKNPAPQRATRRRLTEVSALRRQARRSCPAVLSFHP